MVTTPEGVATESREERVERTARVIVGGHPQAAMRRIVLWVVVFASLTLAAMLDAPADVLPLAACSVAAGLLALTDALV